MNEVEPILTDVDGNRLLPKDRVMILRGKHEGELAKIRRIGLKDWKGSSGRTPRTCAIVEVFGNRWGPFGILGDGVRLLERAGENMVKASTVPAWLHVYRFNLRFYFEGVQGSHKDYDTKDVGAVIAAVTSRGFEMWRGIVPGKNLWQEIGEAKKVTATLLGRKGETGRVVALSVSDPSYLPFGVGIELGGQRVGRLDAMDSEIAMEGVVFRTCTVIGVEDEPSDG